MTVQAARRRAALAGVPHFQPRILGTIPHDPNAYTQGLLHSNDLLYESTGIIGRSTLRCMDPADGRILTVIPVENRFGEGIAIVDDRLFHIAEDSDDVLIYDPSHLLRAPQIIAGRRGWGLTSHSDELILSNGSSVLRYFDTSFRLNRTLSVTSNGMPVRGLNEIQYARGVILANIWYAPLIVEISAVDGHVQRVINCREIVGAANVRNRHEILNGIAYNSTTDQFILGGKNWNRLFVVEIPA